MSSGADGKFGILGSVEVENREAEKLKQRNRSRETEAEKPKGEDDMRMARSILTAAAVTAAFAVTSVAAQAQNVRVRGAIESVDGNTVMVKSRDGASLKLVL